MISPQAVPESGPQSVRVALGERSYDIEISSRILPQAGQFLAARGKVTHAIIITDDNVRRPHCETVSNSLMAAGIKNSTLSVAPGEQAKSVGEAARLWDQMLALGADRKTVVVAVGGGVVGDLAGFIAATYARGLRFFQVPTTLLAQVDSSVGGKVGINLSGAKNMVGSFLQPLAVLIDTDTLETLPKREYISGLAEVIKYGVTLDAAFFAELESCSAQLMKRDRDTLVRVITRCCRLKADVVEQDEREEAGLRAVLNYGHTFAHAFETLLGYGVLLHGEAVSIGMICAARLAEILGRVDATFVARQQSLIAALGLPLAVPKLDPQQLIDTMMHDKKVEHGRLRFVLPTRMGHVELVGNVDPEAVRAALQGS